jgi:hypothetical protein
MKSGLVISVLRPGEFDAVRNAAEADSDGVVFPTHVMRRDGDIVGAMGVNSLPLLTLWMHREKTSALDSVTVLDRVADFMRFTGRTAYAAPCSRTSPFYPHIQRLGFREILDGGLYLRENL